MSLSYAAAWSDPTPAPAWVNPDGPVAYPASGPSSWASASAPSSTLFNPPTGVSLVVDSRWARAAYGAAAGTTLSGSCFSCQCSATGSSASDLLGSAFPNPGAGLLLPGAAAGGFDLAAAAGLLGLLVGAGGGAAASAGVAAALLSLMGGRAALTGQSSAAVCALLGRALADPAGAALLVDAALAVAGGVLGGATALFSSAFAQAGSGLLGLGDAGIGQVVSGGLWASALALGVSPTGALAELAAVGAPLAAGAALVADLGALGVGLLSPTGSSLSLVSSAAGSPLAHASLGAPGVSAAVASLAAGAVAGAAAALASAALSALAALTGGAPSSPGAALLGALTTSPRSQSVVLIDGSVALLSPAAPPPGAAASGLQAVAALGAGTSSLGAGLFSFAGATGSAALVQSLQLRVPTTSSFAGLFGASPLSTGLSEALVAAQLVLGDSCALEAASFSALSQVRAGLAAQGPSDPVLAAVASLQQALCCQAGTYASSSFDLYAAARLAAARALSLDQLAGLLALALGLAPGACPPGQGPLAGAC